MTKMSKYPRVLLVNLNRFKFEKGRGSKVNASVEFGEQLQLGKTKY